MNPTKLSLFVIAVAWTAVACGTAAIPSVPPKTGLPATRGTMAAGTSATATRRPTPSTTATAIAVPTSAPTPAATSSGVPSLEDGPITPGTYRFIHQNVCDDPPRDCPPEASPPPAVGIEVTVPSGSWSAATDFLTIWPREGESQAGALVMGWTNFWVGLNSEPCSQVSHQVTDIEVGPSVDDFVDAVVAHPKLDTTEPVDVMLGGYSGRFFSLTAPADLSDCAEWRPWDPGFFAQGPSNIWDVWVMDVNGFRIMIVAHYFPDAPADIKSELRAMAESIRFVPSASTGPATFRTAGPATPTPTRAVAVAPPTASSPMTAAPSATAEAEFVRGWPGNHGSSEPGLYSWGSGRCEPTNCVMGVIHSHGATSGDVATADVRLTIREIPELTISAASATWVTVAGHQGLYRHTSPELEEWNVDFDGTFVSISLTVEGNARQSAVDEAHSIVESLAYEPQDNSLGFRLVFRLPSAHWDSPF